MFSLICVWINGWVNNRQAGDLRRHRGHYDVSVMRLGPTVLSQTNIIFKTFSSWDPTSMQQTDREHVPRTNVVKSMRLAGWSFHTTWYHMGSTNQSALNTDFTTDGDPSDNWPNSQISECSCSISHNAPFRTEMCTFLFWMKHCGIWNRCILGFLKLIYSKVPQHACTKTWSPIPQCPLYSEQIPGKSMKVAQHNGVSVSKTNRNISGVWMVSLGWNYWSTMAIQNWKWKWFTVILLLCVRWRLKYWWFVIVLLYARWRRGWDVDIFYCFLYFLMLVSPLITIVCNR